MNSLYYNKFDKTNTKLKKESKATERLSTIPKHALQLNNSVGGTQTLNTANTKACQWSKL